MIHHRSDPKVFKPVLAVVTQLAIPACPCSSLNHGHCVKIVLKTLRLKVRNKHWCHSLGVK